MLLLLSSQLRAQTATLSGTLHPPNGAAPEYATVQLLDTNGHPLLSTFSDSTGQYTFPVERGGRYILDASALGYKNTLSDTLSITAGTVTAPLPVLQPEAQSLNGVTITHSKKLFEMKPEEQGLWNERRPEPELPQGKR